MTQSISADPMAAADRRFRPKCSGASLSSESFFLVLLTAAFFLPFPSIGVAQGTAPSHVSDRPWLSARNEIEATKREAEDARLLGQYLRYRVLVNRLWEYHQNLKSPFWQRHGLDGPTAPEQFLIRTRIALNSAVEQLNLDGCPPRTAASQIGVEVSATGGGGTVNAPGTSYLGTRSPGTTDERIGLVGQNSRNFVSVVGGGLRIDFTNRPFLPGLPGGPSLKFAYSHTSGSQNQSSSTFDPRGDVLLIPGTGDPSAPFSAGVSLTSGVAVGTTGGFNVVTDMVSQRTLSRDDFFFTVEQPVFRNGPVTVSAIAGLNYSKTGLDESFGFSVPRFGISGSYGSNLDLSTFTPLFGGGVNVAVAQLGGPGSPETVIYATALMGPSITSAGGNDRFNLSGLVSTSQVVGLSGDHTGFYGNFTGGVRVAAGDFFGDGSVSYVTSDSFGNIVRTGRVGETSQVNFVRGDALLFKFTAGVKFGGGVRVPVSNLTGQ